jgi:hypothetical protein
MPRNTWMPYIVDIGVPLKSGLKSMTLIPDRSGSSPVIHPNNVASNSSRVTLLLMPVLCQPGQARYRRRYTSHGHRLWFRVICSKSQSIVPPAGHLQPPTCERLHHFDLSVHLPSKLRFPKARSRPQDHPPVWLRSLGRAKDPNSRYCGTAVTHHIKPYLRKRIEQTGFGQIVRHHL